jgi:hypothetical protein
MDSGQPFNQFLLSCIFCCVCETPASVATIPIRSRDEQLPGRVEATEE